MSPFFYSVGISHWNCPLEIREKFNIDKKKSIDFISDLKSINGSAFIITTLIGIVVALILKLN